MKFRTAMVMAAAAATAVSFAAAGSAAAQTLGHQVQRMPASVSQVNGSRLAKGLLSPSAFGLVLTKSGSANTGGKLLSTRIRQTPGSLSCGTFANINYDSGWGNTAGAFVSYENPNWYGEWPFTQYSLGEVVVQFATAHSASTFYNEAYARFAGCRSFPVPNPSDTTPGGGSYDVSDTSTWKTSVSGHKAFVNTELWAPNNAGGDTDYVDNLYTVSGTVVYYLWDVSGTNDEPSPKLMTELIQRVQGLY
ncbi:MAG TPA: hypothetical protein VME19_08490 [Streptosporangiaceae bacterium]|nr:hypothetical protein [Streptosporangiaceae bacterium]